MKDGIGNIIGKTIAGVVTAENPVEPTIQVFLQFTDGTHFEIYGEAFNCAGGVDGGGLSRIAGYISRFGGKGIRISRKPDGSLEQGPL